MEWCGRLRLILLFCALLGKLGAVGGADWLKNPQESPGEEELLSIKEEKAGQQMENTIYVDMDHDGHSELIGVYAVSGVYQTWYCSSDGAVCCPVLENSWGMDFCNLEVLNYDTETHVVIDACCMMGTSKNFSILSLENGEINCLVSNNYGYVYQNEAGDIVLDVEAYDGLYDYELEGLIWHTWKDTYLYFDGEAYKEYGATILSEEAFLAYSNAEKIKKAITENSLYPDSVLELFYFRRNNGIMQIQCNEHTDSGNIFYRYYTVRYSDQALSEELEGCESGQMRSYFSNLEVTY